MADIAQIDPTVDLTNIANTTPAGSPASSNSASDNDAVNTASARVYFGPLQSPEKKLIHKIIYSTDSHRDTLNSNPNDIPLPRSAQFSSPATASLDDTEIGDISDTNDESEDGGEDVPQSRSGTPDNVRFPQDEPSSVLASRIIRAQDNPSPPPRARHIPSFTPSPLKDASFPSVDHSMSPDDDIPNNTDIAIKYSTMFDRLPSLSPKPPNIFTGPPSLTLREALLSPPGESPANIQQELISFESFSTPSTTPVPHESAVAGSSKQSQMGTTVNYLSPSPRHPVSPIRIPCDLTPDTVPSRSTSPTPSPTPSIIRRSPRLSSTEFPLTDRQVPSPYERSSRPEPKSPSSFPPVVNHVAQSDEPQPQTPRRSPRHSVTPQDLKPMDVTRPRSTSPLLLGLTTSLSIQERPDTPPAIGAVRELAEPPSGAQTREKGKEKAWGDVIDVSQEDQIRSASAEIEEKEEPVEGKAERKWKLRQEHGGGKEDKMYRQLGSLSPGSANVLAQLHPSIQATITPDDSATKAKDVTEEVPLEANKPIFSAQRNRTFASIQRPPPGSPIRFTSPPGGRPSPTKLIPNLNLDDPMRTPARRIPIRQPIVQGTASAQKLGQMNGHSWPTNSALAASLRSPVFTRPALDDSLRSPARRIPISEVMASMKQGPRHGSRSPVRGFSRERSGSAEPRAQNRSGSVEPPRPMDLPPSSASTRPVSKLPFPLVATQPSGHDRPTSIPEETEAPLSPGAEIPPEDDKPALSSSSSPAKSNLKQPSSSRIPRIGVKPYVRPIVGVMEKESKLTVARKAGATDSGTTKPSKSVRTVRSGSGSGSSSDDINIGPGGSALAKSAKDKPASANLKRKRGVEKTSPLRTRPVVLIRQVVPGMLGPKYTSVAAAAPPTKNTVPNQVVSPTKKLQRPMTMRRVVGKPPEKNVARDRVEEEADAPDIVDEDIGETTMKRDWNPDNLLVVVPRKSSRPAARDVTVLSSSPFLSEHTPMPSQDITDNVASDRCASPFEDDTEPSMKVRRTTRSRKQTVANDVFTAPRPLQPRRKNHTSNRLDADGFSGLSSVALKALTSSNTAKNQQNFVNLATEVIRKDGRRPESPMMKVRTISQREAEEKSKGRSERAYRRAQRSDDGMSDTDGFSSDRGDSSIVEAECRWDGEKAEEVHPHKHRRGPGDEEDYETPKSLKRPRSGEDAEDVIQEKKRVKWDRGLYSEIYLDEIEVKPKKRPKEDIVKKGCLAPTAKALRLDTLGNIINADLPLTDLVHENIVVKKFIYDNDVEPEVPIVKTTRSRGRKAKS